MASVSVSKLKAAASALLEHLEKTAGEEINIEEDFYWDIAMQKRYDQYEEPKEFTVGQLSSDLDEVMALAEGTKEPVNYGLVWLSQVLRRVGESQPG